ncbi:MAG TPA: GNAT family N-acetyltransferase [Candidatus Butyricicoccus avicola]|nr:GNAT family N-acetyltransferase [Candidatus Butyricicoccus avicola]
MIRFAAQADLPAIRELWEQCFPDDTGFNPYYFRHHFSLEHTLLYLVNSTVAAMVQMLPYTLQLGQDLSAAATYIYGACTHPGYRRQHLMSQLLTESFALDRAQGRAASMLIPQEDWLFDFYRPFGYQPLFSVHADCATVKPQLSSRLRPLTAQDLAACQALYRAQTVSYDFTVVRSASQWDAQLTLFQQLGAGAFAWESNTGTLTGYAFVWQEHDGVWAQELVCADPTQVRPFLSALAAEKRCTAVRWSGPGSPETPLGCILFYDKQPFSHGYMNLMFN